MRETLHALMSRVQKPDVQGAHDEAYERADGRERNRPQYTRKLIATPRAKEQAEYTEDGRDDVVNFSHEQGGGRLRGPLQEGGFA